MTLPTTLSRNEQVFTVLYLSLNGSLPRVGSEGIEKLSFSVTPQNLKTQLPSGVHFQRNIPFNRELPKTAPQSLKWTPSLGPRGAVS